MDVLIAAACAALLIPSGDTLPRATAADTTPAATLSGRRAGPSGVQPASVQRRDSVRHRAIEYSDWYNRRLTIHRWGSYAMLPLFAIEYSLGNKLLQEGDVSRSVRDNHRLVASGLGVLFTTNTITGAWNLVESWPDRVGRGRRVLHTALLLASDAGFLYTGSLAEDAREERDGANRHRNAALVSMGLSAAGTALMWFWKN